MFAPLLSQRLPGQHSQRSILAAWEPRFTRELYANVMLAGADLIAYIVTGFALAQAQRRFTARRRMLAALAQRRAIHGGSVLKQNGPREYPGTRFYRLIHIGPAHIVHGAAQHQPARKLCSL